MRETKITISSNKEPFQTVIYCISFNDTSHLLKEIEKRLNLLSFKKFNCTIENKNDFNKSELLILKKEGFYFD